MGFRFQKRIKVAPGVYVNLNKGTPSVSVGGHGLTTNLSTRGLMTTASIPGTGLSYRHNWNGARNRTDGNRIDGQTREYVAQKVSEMRRLFERRAANPKDVNTLLRLIAVCEEIERLGHVYAGGAGTADMHQALIGLREDLEAMTALSERHIGGYVPDQSASDQFAAAFFRRILKLCYLFVVVLAFSVDWREGCLFGLGILPVWRLRKF